VTVTVDVPFVEYEVVSTLVVVGQYDVYVTVVEAGRTDVFVVSEQTGQRVTVDVIVLVLTMPEVVYTVGHRLVVTVTVAVTELVVGQSEIVMYSPMVTDTSS